MTTDFHIPTDLEIIAALQERIAEDQQRIEALEIDQAACVTGLESLRQENQKLREEVARLVGELAEVQRGLK